MHDASTRQHLETSKAPAENSRDIIVQSPGGIHNTLVQEPQTLFSTQSSWLQVLDVHDRKAGFTNLTKANTLQRTVKDSNPQLPSRTDLESSLNIYDESGKSSRRPRCASHFRDVRILTPQGVLIPARHELTLRSNTRVCSSNT